MSEETLVIERLPDDFENVRLKLDLHFKNRRRSGGEAMKIVEHPDDTRKALIVYTDDRDIKNVLERVHQIDFKDVGLVELTVKMHKDENVQTKLSKVVRPSVLPRPKSVPFRTTVCQPASECHKENKQDFRNQSLLVKSTEIIDEDIITLYFEQFLESFEIIKYEPNSWILKLANHSDLVKILGMKEHDFGLSVEEYKDGTEAKKDPHRFILTGFKDSCKIKLIPLFISSCSQKTEHTWELLNDDRIVVTFKQDIDVKQFLSKCTTKKLQGMEITASQLELTNSVLVQGDMSQIKEEILTAHFSDKVKSRGGDIHSLVWVNKQRSVIITFKNHHTAYQVVEQKHRLGAADLTAHLFYSSFQKSLTGEIPTLSGIQTNITISVNEHVLSFIENNEQYRNYLQGHLSVVHACVLFGKTTSSGQLVVEMTAEKETFAALQVGPTWENKARKIIQDFLAKYSAIELAVEAEIWNRVESTCLTLVTTEAKIFCKQKGSNSMIVIVGQNVQVNALSDNIRKLLNTANAEFEAEKNQANDVTVEESIPVRSMGEVEFIESCMNLLEIPGIKNHGITIVASGTEHSPYLKVTARKEKIQDVVKLIRQQLSFIVMEKHTYSKAGQSKVLEKNEANAKAKAKQLHCNLYLSTEQPRRFGPTKSFTHKIGSSITLIVAEGDLHQHTVDALICPLTSSLAFDNPTARQFLKVGGYQVQEVCRRLQRGKQTLLAGDVVISDSGDLHTNTLIYAVLPKKGQLLDSHYLQTAILASLQKAEERCSESVAMPVICCGTFEFSIKESCDAIKEAIVQFINDHQDARKNLRNIIVIDSDVKTVEEFSHSLVQLGFPHESTSSYPASLFLETSVVKSDTSVTMHGVLVSLKKGDITKETADVIINSNSRDSNLHLGVCGAIFKAAGKSVVDEYRRYGHKLEEVILTSGGNLSCKHIAHMFGPTNAADIAISIEKVLKLCESKMAATVAIPAIGTGGGGISAHESIKAIFTALENHLIKLNSSYLKKISVVAIDRMIWEVYRDYFKERNRKSQPETILEYGIMAENQVRIQGVRIVVKKGDITAETAQAIVNTTNNKMDLKTGVSGAIFTAAGHSVEKECCKLDPLQSDTVAVTSAGNLQSDFLIHMLGPHSAAHVRLRVKKVLERCEQKKINTISFPAVGIGRGGVKSAEAIGAMLQGFKDHLSQRSFTAVKLIYVVINQNEVLEEFQQGLKEWITNNQENDDNDNNESDERNSCEDEDFTAPKQQHQNPTKQSLNLATEISAVSFPITTVEVYGTSSADLAKVKKFMDDLISDECTSMEIQSSYLDNLPEATKNAIVDLSRNNQVHIDMLSPDKITVSGKKDDVCDAYVNINKFIQVAKERETQKIEEKRIRETLRWEVAVEDTWVPLDSTISYQLELAFHNKKLITIYEDDEETYTVDFKEFRRISSKGTSCRIKRTLLGDSDTAIIHPPPTWTKMDGKDLKIISLTPDSEEYKKIQREFIRSSKHPDVFRVQIYRIQSQPQWQRYSVLKQAVDKKYPNQKNETFLYHGTTKEICEKINKNGFNRSFCGRNAVRYGEGTYFAKEAWYSCQDEYSNPDENGLKYIYRARVVTGSQCQGREGMKEPDPLDPNDPRAGLYECAVDDLQNPLIFVVFCDAGAYPDYLIVFKNF